MRDIVLVYARAENGVIGRDGSLPWHLPADLKHFKAVTLGPDGKGLPMIMGRKTFDSFPAPLPGRRHIVLTRDNSWQAAGAEVAHTVAEALVLAGEGDIAVIGGAEIYALFEPVATRVELTEIAGAFDGDTVMPPLGPHWRETKREAHPAEGTRPAYAFVTLVRGL